MQIQAQNARSDDQRADERVSVTLAGKLFVPAEEVALDCTIVNLSAGGAGLYCPEPPPLDAFVVLYVDGFGRFEAVTACFTKGELHLKFLCKEAKRKRLEQDLARFVSEGGCGVTRMRRHPRSAASKQFSRITRADGESVTCELLDVSLQGALLKTDMRPPIGEVIHLGQTRGWVVRHQDDGVGIQFQQRPGPTDGH
jgi:hypothetical protein